MTTVDPYSYAMPAGVWIVLVLAVITSLLLRNTVLGRHVFALGSNEATARLCGIPTRRLKIVIYTLAGCFFGLAGFFSSRACARVIRRSPSAWNWTSSPR